MLLAVAGCRMQCVDGQRMGRSQEVAARCMRLRFRRSPRATISPHHGGHRQHAEYRRTGAVAQDVR
jgi:hypothetical protein